MSNMLEKTFTNKDLGIELTSFIDKQQNVWFKGKDVAEIHPKWGRWHLKW